MIATADGAIARLLIAVPRWVATSAYMEDRYRELFAALSEDTCFVILTHRDASVTIREWLAAEKVSLDRVEWVIDDNHIRFTYWAQDPMFLVENDDGDVYIAEPFRFDRAADAIVGDLVATQLGIPHAQVPLAVHGGNILVGDDFYLIGLDHLKETEGLVEDVLLARPDISPVEQARELFDRFVETRRSRIEVGADPTQKPVIPGLQARTFYKDGVPWTEKYFRDSKDSGSWQPFFHLDMFMTLAGRGADGRYRLVVADPNRAQALLAQHAPGHPWPDHGAWRSRFFDQEAAKLEDRFEVWRNPVPLVFEDNPRETTREWYYAAYNNALVELGVRRSDGSVGNKIYLPTYGHGERAFLKVIDEANQELWKGLGFEVVALGDYNLLAKNLGAVHCITKDLKRRKALSTGGASA